MLLQRSNSYGVYTYPYGVMQRRGTSIPYDHFSHTPFESVIRDLSYSSSLALLRVEKEKMAAVNDTVLVGDDLRSTVHPIKHDLSSSLSSSKDNINVLDS